MFPIVKTKSINFIVHPRHEETIPDVYSSRSIKNPEIVLVMFGPSITNLVPSNKGRLSSNNLQEKSFGIWIQQGRRLKITRRKKYVGRIVLGYRDRVFL